jgi:hypothetical protein
MTPWYKIRPTSGSTLTPDGKKGWKGIGLTVSVTGLYEALKRAKKWLKLHF